MFDNGNNNTVLEQTWHLSGGKRRFLLFDDKEAIWMIRTEEWKALVKKIAEAALAGDHQRLELILLKTIRSLKCEHPDLSEELAALLSQYSLNPNSLRWKDTGPPPADAEQGLSLVRTERLDDVTSPIFPADLNNRIQQFLEERKDTQRLLREGYSPPRSILLVGPPGTGKTMLARWFARKLELPFLTIDLATSISSFLGKTGLNLRRILDYARSRQCVLFLDEFDAIAKRRDDTTELGELKRIVNVLLKELEDWPMHSVLVAATNHPDLLDSAVRRRFDLNLDLPLPGDEERLAILERSGGRFASEISDSLLRACALSLNDVSASDVESLMQAAIRHHLTASLPLPKCLITEVQLRFRERIDGKNVGMLIRTIRNDSKRTFTVRELADIFGKSTSTIQHHLTKEAADGRQPAPPDSG